MPVSAADTVTVALIGNPNTGKSALFNVLVGVRQRVGNYPGVTVEKRIGHTEVDGTAFSVIDLPGTYSLAPRSPDERIAVDLLLGRLADVPAPDVILCIIDASNLERNLYLVSQVLELGRPVVVALNMVDIAEARGIAVDAKRLQARLGVPVVPTQAHRRVGLVALRAALVRAVQAGRPASRNVFPEVFQREVATLERALQTESGVVLPRYLVERLLLDVGGYLLGNGLSGVDARVVQWIQAARARLAAEGLAVPAVEATARYRWIDKILDGVVTRRTLPRITLSDRVDRLLTHRVLGTLTFVVVMVLVFQSIFTWSAPAMDAVEWVVEWLSNSVAATLPAGALRSLVTGGVIAGVGSVLVFLPQILILFFFIAVLEDCGYMARAAYLMDRLMTHVGLSGKSFIPLLSSFACAVPGIMAARVIENRRDRLVTIVVAPLMSCSARLPIYTLLIAAFIPELRLAGGWLNLQGLVMFALYLLGIATAVVVAWLLNHTLLRGQTAPFVMELPGYRIPSLRNVLLRMLDRGWTFVRQAGTLIFAIAIVVWAAAYFPHRAEVEREVRARYGQRIAVLQAQLDRLPELGVSADAQGAANRARLARQLAAAKSRLSSRVAAAYMADSLLGRLGRLLEPAVRPLGWDWRIGCAVAASFPAREVVIGTLGVIYDLGEGQETQSTPLREKLRAATWPGTGRPVFNIPVALSIMVFFALCAQCAATLVVMWRETGGWRWPAFTFGYMTALAYLGALATYQIGIRLFS